MARLSFFLAVVAEEHDRNMVIILSINNQNTSQNNEPIIMIMI